MSISARTVGTHRRHICEKLGLSGSHSLMQFAMENREFAMKTCGRPWLWGCLLVVLAAGMSLAAA
jgi:hypothetical protein